MAASCMVLSPLSCRSFNKKHLRWGRVPRWPRKRRLPCERLSPAPVGNIVLSGSEPHAVLTSEMWMRMFLRIGTWVWSQSVLSCHTSQALETSVESSGGRCALRRFFIQGLETCSSRSEIRACLRVEGRGSKASCSEFRNRSYVCCPESNGLS